jgi:hypothetical protein
MTDISSPLLGAVRDKLSTEDDPLLWEAVLTILANEFLRRYENESDSRSWYFLFGACSHWVRPHNSRWNAAGGFVFPEGYQNGVPELDWTVITLRDGQSWRQANKLSSKRQIVFRAAIPSRSARHQQAVVHTKWSISQDPVLYGFRKLDGPWRCVAASDERSQGKILEYVRKEQE